MRKCRVGMGNTKVSRAVISGFLSETVESLIRSYRFRVLETDASQEHGFQ